MLDSEPKPEQCFCEFASFYALDLLDVVDRAWVEVEVAKSLDLKAELTDLQAVVSLLPYGVPILPVPFSLKSRLFERLELAIPTLEATHSTPSMATISVPDNGQRHRGFRQRCITRFWIGGIGVLVAFFMGLIGVDNYRLRQAAQLNQSLMVVLQQPNTSVFKLQGTSNARQATGSLVIDPQRNVMMIFTQNLPSLSSSQRYRLWAVIKGDTQPTYCGQFMSQRSGRIVRWAVPNIMCHQSDAKMFLTTENMTTPLKPMGPLVMRGLVQ